MQKYSFLSVFLNINSKNEKMTLVTGATGLVGGNLLWYLLQDNERVLAIRRTSSSLKPLRTIFCFYTSEPDKYLERIDWIVADVLDENSLWNAMINVSVVYHCAAVVSLSGVSGSLTETNVTGTRNVVKVALESGVKKLCFVSSIAACGKSKTGQLIDENTIWEDHPHKSDYNRSKFYSEQEVWKGIEKGLNAIIVNPGVILGISGSNTGSAQLFSQVKKGLKFYTNGGSGYVDVQDVVQSMIELMKSDIKNERFILVAENCSNKEVLSWIADGYGKLRPKIGIGKNLLLSIGYLSEKIGKIFHFTPLIDRGTARSAVQREYYSNEKIKKAIGFEFEKVEKSILQICSFDKCF